MPTPPTSPVFPFGWGGNPFQGGGSTSNFNDLLGATNFTSASSTIDDNYNPAGTLTADAEVVIPFWNVTQGPTAPGYAYEQLNFTSSYAVQSNPLGLFGSTPSFPISIGGSVVPGGGAYAQFDAVINYSWTPVNAALQPTGATVSLGQLNYSFLQSGGGAFSTTLFNSSPLSASPAGDGVLELTGHMWIAGDPYTFNINGAVPEPASLLAAGAIAALFPLRRHRARPTN